MKPTYQIEALSASTSFAPINIVSITPSTPTTIHTAHATNIDELWIEAYNYSAADVMFYLGIAGTNPVNYIPFLIPANRGTIPILKGTRTSGGILIRGYASEANTIAVIGSVNRIVFI